ncbi:GPALPP motifs-containing protein 1 [Trichinella pseudospiralis]|uniref:GPALPP motifs-containing protein 1 n=1 Tax=Trichinella pseudospiralis TaxID=6337 RepID=A0A0V1JCL9_TRIPS|nr:GPALPP motifs-containing protein 1 [Trichinella pseudospiralis]
MEIGPQLPPSWGKKSSFSPSSSKSVSRNERASNDNDNDDDDDDNGKEDVQYGPALPPDFVTENVEEEDSSDELIGPTLSDIDSSKEHDEDYFIRLAQIRQANSASEKQGKLRESWMTELPPTLKSFGLGARTFRKHDVVDLSADRSVWTDTPSTAKLSDDERKRHHRQSKAAKRTDEMIDAELAKRDRLSSPSLLDLHKKRKIQEKSSTGNLRERIPFDREKDMKLPTRSAINQGDLLERLGTLTGRFSNGTERKYL